MVKTILGISMGTRLVGVAIMRDGELIDYRVKVFKRRWSRNKEKEIFAFIEKLSEHYSATPVALKLPNPFTASKQLKRLTIKLGQFLQTKTITIHQYSIATVKLGLGIKASNKDEFMGQIAERYLHLRREYLKEINNRHSYYERMFEAIAVAKWCELENQL